jgi:hypothetical protein
LFREAAQTCKEIFMDELIDMIQEPKAESLTQSKKAKTSGKGGSKKEKNSVVDDEKKSIERKDSLKRKR